MPYFQSLTDTCPNGVTNANDFQTLGQAGFPDPSFAHVYFNDFDTYTAGDWTVTTVTAGAPTQALAAGLGGRLLVTNTNGAADATYMQKNPAGFNIPQASPSPSTGKQTFFKFQGQLSAVNLDVFFCGLAQAGATTIASITNGIYIAKATAQTGLTLNIVVASVTTTIAFPATCVLTAATDFELGFFVDVYGNVAGFWNPTTGWSTPITSANLAAGTQTRGYACAVYAPALPTPATLVSPIFGLLNSSGVANTLQVDYILASNDR